MYIDITTPLLLFQMSINISIKLFASLIKTKHQAVHVTTSDDFIQEAANDRHEKILLYDLQPQYIDDLFGLLIKWNRLCKHGKVASANRLASIIN